MKRVRLGILAGAGVFFLGCVAGCGTVDDSSDAAHASTTTIDMLAADARENGWLDQVAYFADGVISDAEYHEAIQGTLACYADAGLPYREPELDVLSSVTYLLPAGVGDLDPDDVAQASFDCLDRYMFNVETGYLITHPPYIAESLRTEIAHCLAGEGFDLAGDERSVPDYVQTIGADNISVLAECGRAGAAITHPETVTLAWAY